MGNWRTVHVTGSMTEDHARALSDLLDRGDDDDWPGWGEPYECLGFSSSRPGLHGLGAWPAAKVDRTGNIGKDCSVQEVADALRALVCIAPTMLLKVHCGGDWESSECVATISVGEGCVVTGEPEVATIDGPPDEQMLRDLMTNLTRGSL
jgi:hypothetical protein